jgi:succinate-semialdehyde dehydrogenase/glutarate-semialdehyde dehydrogenase
MTNPHHQPPAETPFTALALGEVSVAPLTPTHWCSFDPQLAIRAGVPEGVINIVTTEKNLKDVGREMCENPIVKKVSFTGSTPVAKLIATQAASTLKKCVVTISYYPPWAP